MTSRAREEQRERYRRLREGKREANDLHAEPETRVEMDLQQMITELLGLFEEHEYWKKAEILLRTNQPDKLVTQALNELTIMHSTGEHKRA